MIGGAQHPSYSARVNPKCKRETQRVRVATRTGQTLCIVALRLQTALRIVKW